MGARGCSVVGECVGCSWVVFLLSAWLWVLLYGKSVGFA